MPLIVPSGAAVFDAGAIGRGDLIRAKYLGWDGARNGVVVQVEGDEVSVLYRPEIANVISFFSIRAGEVEAGDWEILWTHDFTQVFAWPEGAGEP